MKRAIREISENRRTVGQVFDRWKRAVSLIFCIFLFLQVNVLYAQRKSASVRMIAQPKQVFQGESFRLQFYLENFEKPEQPNLSYLSSEFEVAYMGAQDQSRSSIYRINGRETKTETRAILYVFQLTPKKSGKIRIEGPVIKEKGKAIPIDPVQIEVVPPNDKGLVYLEMESSAQEVYPLTPFTITLNVYVAKMPGKFGEDDPVLSLSGRVEPSNLQIPWLQDDQLQKGLVPKVDWEEWLRGYRNNRGGFVVNNIRISDPMDFGFSLFENSRRIVAFLPKGIRTERTDASGKKNEYWKYVFSRTFTAEKTGEYVFGPSALKGVFAAVDVQDGLKVEPVFTTSKPITVKVRDVPEQGRPDDYIGAFGTFNWTSSIAPDKAQVGQALTLTLTLQGQGSVLQVKAPDLEKVPDIAGNFKIYPPTEQIADNQAVFTYSIRAIKEGKIEFPAVSISYFDIKTDKFVSVASKPIALDIEKSPVLQTEALSPEVRQGLRTKTTLTRSKEGIYADMNDLDGMADARVTLQQWLEWMSFPLGIGLFGWLLLRLWSGGGLNRLKKSLKNGSASRHLLAEGLSELDGPDGRSVASAVSKIRQAFLLPVSDCFDKPIGTLSEAEIDLFLERFAALPGNKDLLDPLHRLFENLERVRYGQDSGAVSEIEKEAGDLFNDWQSRTSSKKIRRILRISDKDNRFEPMQFLLPFIAISLFSICSGCARVPDGDTRANFDEAVRLCAEADKLYEQEEGQKSNKSGQSAKPQSSDRPSLSELRRELCLKTAALYQGILDRGIESGPILYNQGNAYYRSGEKAKALAAWRRAQRYIPTDPYLQANIDLLAPTTPESKKTVSEYILFWQNKISYPLKYRLALIGFCVLIALLLLNAFLKIRRQKSGDSFSGGRVLVYSIVFTTLFFAAIGYSALYDRYRFDVCRYGITRTADAVVRKGNSPQYEPVFKEALHELTELTILEERGNWCRIRLEDGQEGWLKKSELVVY